MRKAFTLIEVLVVVSIIALLIAILLPVLSQTRYTANLTKCKVLIKGIGDVQLSYAIDNDGFLPTDGYRYGTNPGETGSWFQASIVNGAQERAWWLKNTTRPNGGWNLVPIYEDYMQRHKDIDSVLHCPLGAPFFEGNNNGNSKNISYAMYVTNNYRTKIFYYKDVGAYEQMGTWTPRDRPDLKFSMLVSDFAVARQSGKSDPSVSGDDVTGAMTAHPASNGQIGTHNGFNNSFGGFIVGADQNAPLNFMDADGSVQEFKVNANSYLDTDTWAYNGMGSPTNPNGKLMLPLDLQK